MKALTWHGRRDVRVEDVPDATIVEPTDAVIRVTTTAICGSDLHLYEVLGPFIREGMILGHEPMGIVEMASRIAMHKGRRVIAVDLVDERLDRARSRGAEVLDLREHEKDVAEVIREMTDGRGTDSVIDAVGMEAHGSPGAKLAQTAAGFLPDAVAEKVMKTG